MPPGLGQEVCEQHQRDRPARVKALVGDQDERDVPGTGPQLGLAVGDEEAAKGWLTEKFEQVTVSVCVYEKTADGARPACPVRIGESASVPGHDYNLA
jgi:hypothetical protein